MFAVASWGSSSRGRTCTKNLILEPQQLNIFLDSICSETFCTRSSDVSGIMKVYFSPLKSLCHPSWSKAKQLKNSWLCWLIEDSETFLANFDPCIQSLQVCPFMSLQRIIPAETQRRETLIHGLQVTSCRQIPWKHGGESLTGEDTRCLIYSVIYCLTLIKPLSTALIVIKWVTVTVCWSFIFN